MRVPSDNVIIKMEKTVDDQYLVKNGKVIYLDTNLEWEPPEGKSQIKANLIVCAEAIGVPEKLADKHRLDVWPVRRANDIHLSAEVYRYYKFRDKYMDDIVPEVEKGDLIYFNWTAINESNLFELNNEEVYYKVPYPDIICTIKAGSIVPVGGNILMEPYYGEGEFRDIGKLRKFGYKNENGLFTLCKPLEGFGEVVHIGKPLKGEYSTLNIGDVVKYNHKLGLHVKIEDKDYINIKYWDVVMCFEKAA